MPLNPRQQKFVAEYLRTKNATQAALDAGYSVKTAASIGGENLQKPEIKSEIDKGLKLQNEKIEKLADKEVVFTKAMWLRELKILAMSNIDDFIRIEEFVDRVIEETGETKIVITVVPVPTAKRRLKILGKAIKKISETKNGIAIELHSKQAALDTLGRHYGWVKDNVEVDDKNKPKVVFTVPKNGREKSENEEIKTNVTEEKIEKPDGAD